MIDGLIAGRLIGDPEQRVGKAESRFVVAKVRAPSSDGENLMVNVIAFDEAVGQALLALRDGDSVALAGSLTPKAWTDKQGNVKPALDLIAQRVVSAYPG
ncbi:single-stranded DNA-binding protein [Rhodoferax antarcticus]|uniref:Single-strand binding family protein n=1 Tax=Rhodoferax antarcticus ANT.BR TaxID=1111071 RepID=A0A1Q8YJX6_9BURK|nr:single-stranded DNA-binding protein [Rhodoferax antarcticus]APW47679.1 single-stranded DNA-binding protein [Rhodoferax antarcticus]MCW2314088.1 single-stranded DNA-binding protein [Rhodoferax antarcticus]OLP08200.1 single-strand binding family protein [Rhodoferax antarcticus ANT.BR]